MRLDKFLSHVGVGTRSQVKQIVKQKRVSVNGVIVKKSDLSINETKDSVCVDDKLLQYEQYQYIMLHKPQGVISATQDDVHKTVLDIVPIAKKDVFPVGRLDIDTEGLLLLTNNGQLAHQLLSPKKHVSKQYYVVLEKALHKDDIETLEKGIVIDDGYQCLPAIIDNVENNSCYITIYEGKYHQIKRMFNALDNKVMYLKRLSMGCLTLDNTLKLGEYRVLTDEEIGALFH